MQETKETKVLCRVGKISWRRKWQPAIVFLPGEAHGQRSLVDSSPWSCKELDTPKQLSMQAWWAKTATTRPKGWLLRGKRKREGQTVIRRQITWCQSSWSCGMVHVTVGLSFVKCTGMTFKAYTHTHTHTHTHTPIHTVGLACALAH